MKTHPLWRRIAVQLGGRFDLLPGSMSVKEWLWSPFAGITFPDQIVKRGDMPDEWKRDNIRLLSWEDNTPRSNYFWARAGIRILGLDLGIGIFYLRNPK